MVDLGLVSNLSGTVMFLVLALLLLANWRGQIVGGMLLVSVLISTICFALLSLYTVAPGYPLLPIQLLEIGRSTAWLAFLYVVLSRQPSEQVASDVRQLLPLISGLPALLVVLVIYTAISDDSRLFGMSELNPDYLAHICIALVGLMLLEKLYRSASPSSRWSLKHMCLGIGGILIYDLFLYADGMMFSRLAPHLLDARGAVNALCVPFIALSVARNTEWKLDLFVSRHVIYHSTVALSAGIYLLLMAFAGYYVKVIGGEWGTSLQIIFFFGALLILLMLFLSTDLRARLKVFIAKHFYRNKYDYREEWLRFARALAGNKDDSEIYRRIINAVAGVIKSPGGGLWLEDNEHYILIDKCGLYENLQDEISQDEEFIRFMKESGWIINLDEYKSTQHKYDDLKLPSWISSSERIWLIMPLFNKESLSGFMMLARPHGSSTFDWEDIDLMKTVGFQTASYIDFLRASNALAESRQFDAFNRLSAFMVHDIKNVLAQLTLVTSNLPKFRDNPKFVDDAFETVKHAQDKMENILGYIGKGQVINSSAPQKIALDVLIREIVNARSASKPAPVLDYAEPGIVISIEKDKFTAALEHLVQNAQEAVTEDGEVTLRLEHEGNTAIITISDNGCGMDEEFIRNRLFKPFDTTKGNAGMGIGVYESREIIRGAGGNIRVSSCPGKGTVFTLTIPCVQQKEETQTAGIHI